MSQVKILNKWESRQELLALENKEKQKQFAKRKEKLKKKKEAHAKAVENSKGYTPGPQVKKSHWDKNKVPKKDDL